MIMLIFTVVIFTFVLGDNTYILQDLTRWWFKMKCSKGKFSVDSVSYGDVISFNNLTNKLD